MPKLSALALSPFLPLSRPLLFSRSLACLLVHSMADFHVVALVTWVATVSGFPESNFSVANTHTETWFVFFLFNLQWNNFCFVLFRSAKEEKTRESRDWNYRKTKKDQPRHRRFEWIELYVHCALARLSYSVGIGLGWCLIRFFFLSCHNNTANWNFSSVYFWNNLNVNARFEQKRPATATASTTKVLNTHIHALALTSLLRKTLSSKCFFLLFYFVAEVLLSNAFPLALSQISEHGQVCIYLRAFWHNFANFMWKHKNMNGGRAFTESYRRTFFHETNCEFMVCIRDRASQPTEFNFNGNVCNFVWLVWNCKFLPSFRQRIVWRAVEKNSTSKHVQYKFEIEMVDF